MGVSYEPKSIYQPDKSKSMLDANTCCDEC